MAMDPELVQGLAVFRYALRRFLAASEAISREAGITPQQYQAMLAIKAGPAEGRPMKDLADQLYLTHHAAVQLVDRMTKAGCATRQRSNSDRRSVLLSLTPAGERLLETLAARHLQEMLRQEPELSRSLRNLKRLGA